MKIALHMNCMLIITDRIYLTTESDSKLHEWAPDSYEIQLKRLICLLFGTEDWDEWHVAENGPIRRYHKINLRDAWEVIRKISAQTLNKQGNVCRKVSGDHSSWRATHFYSCSSITKYISIMSFTTDIVRREWYTIGLFTLAAKPLVMAWAVRISINILLPMCKNHHRAAVSACHLWSLSPYTTDSTPNSAEIFFFTVFSPKWQKN